MKPARRKTNVARMHPAVAASAASLPIPITGDGTILTVAPDRAIIIQGAPSDAVFFLHTGTVKAYVLSETGKQAVFLIISPNRFFGESCLAAGDTRRVASATAMTECAVERIDIAAMRRHLANDPRFAKQFLDHLVKRNQELLYELSGQFFYSTEKRLARALLRLAEIGRVGETPSLYVTQETLADMVGTTRSRVNVFMNKFRRLGLIEYDRHGRLSVRDSLIDIVQVQ